MFRTALISMFITSTAFSTTWIVDDDGKADFDNIQAAVDASSDGDEIIVMPGTYTWSSCNFLLCINDKNIWLHSAKGPQVTVIDGQGGSYSWVVFNKGITSKTTFEGFKIIGGKIVLSDSSPNVKNCIFENNDSDYGGAMYIGGNCNPAIYDCTFKNNSSRWDGGAVYVANGSATFTSCIFQNNVAGTHPIYDGNGAAVSLANANASFDSCSFTNNQAYQGGAVALKDNSTSDFNDCLFKSNHASANGGACHFYNESNSVFNNCIFDSNNGSSDGGSIFMWGSDSSISNCSFINNNGQVGGALAFDHNSNPIVQDCIFENNSATHGGAIYGCIPPNYDSLIVLERTQFLNNYATGYGGAVNIYGSDALIDSCIFEYNTGGEDISTGNAGAIYVSCAGCYEGYTYLSNSSFCSNFPQHISSSVNDSGGNVYEDDCDSDGDGVPNDADNCYLYNPDQTDCNGNGVGDVCDIADLESYDINENGIPDECECLADIALDDGQVNVHDLLSLIAVWGTDSSSADINYDGIVNVHDLLLLIGAWGECE